MITPIDYTTYEKPSDFYKMKDGKQVVQIISKGNLVDEYGMRTARGWIRFNEEEGKRKNLESKKRFTWIILDSNKRVKILQTGVLLGDQIAMLGKEYGDPQNYEIEITKSGTGFDTKYSVKKMREVDVAILPVVESEKIRLMKKYFL